MRKENRSQHCSVPYVAFIITTNRMCYIGIEMIHMDQYFLLNRRLLRQFMLLHIYVHVYTNITFNKKKKSKKSETIQKIAKKKFLENKTPYIATKHVCILHIDCYYWTPLTLNHELITLLVLNLLFQ